MRLDLSPHPTCVPSPLRTLAVDVQHAPGDLEMRNGLDGSVQVYRKGGALTVIYELSGDMDRIRWPEPRVSERAEGLWTTTCLEAFVRAADGQAYYEFNFSPSGRWATYRFDSERQGMVDLEGYDPEVAFERGVDHARLIARIRLPLDAVGPVGLSAVIEDANRDTTYWGLAHPSPKPDFHAPGAFALTLEPA